MTMCGERRLCSADARAARLSRRVPCISCVFVLVLGGAACAPSPTLLRHRQSAEVLRAPTEVTGPTGRGGANAAVEAAPLWTPESVAALEARRAPPSAFVEALAPDVPVAVRVRALRALARVGHRDAAPHLLEALRDASPPVRRVAAFALGQLEPALFTGLSPRSEVSMGPEEALVAALTRESDAEVAAALLRALGRVARGPGVDALLAAAAAREALRATALVALGVVGARLDAPLRQDPRLRAQVMRSLASQDVQERRAAAYALFRHRLAWEDGLTHTLENERDAQTRIHLVRALAVQPAPVTLRWSALWRDADWRVQVEALRALLSAAWPDASLPVAAIESTLQRSVDALVREGTRGDGRAQVVVESCRVLAAPHAGIPPERAAYILAHAIERLQAAGAAFAPLACACAVTHDAIWARPERVRSCVSPDWPEERVRRLEVEVLSQARASTRERAAWLISALADPAPAVRGTAAAGLVALGERHVAERVAPLLRTESDPALLAHLLALFVGPHGELLTDDDLAFLAHTWQGVAEVGSDADAATREAAHDVLRVLDRVASGSISPRVQRARAGLAHASRAPLVPAQAPAFSRLPLGAHIVTSAGSFRIAFEREGAPLAVASFSSLAERAYFDGMRFHRVVANFVTQGGDPRGDGSGGPGYTLPCEVDDVDFARGAMGVAIDDKDSGGSQFFITHSDQPHLEGRYTRFGRVVEGMEVVDALLPDDHVVRIDLMGGDPSTTWFPPPGAGERAGEQP